MAEDNIISVKDLWFKYAKSEDWVLKGVNLDVKRGEFLVITGANQSGKTTLSLALTGFIPHDIPGHFKGNVIVDGVNTKNSTPSKLARKIGLLFPEPESQFLGVTVQDDIVFGPENLGLPVEEIGRRLKWVLEVTRLTELADKPPIMLSGGQKQRTAIAGILAMLPSILILDEPTVELDPIGKMEVISVINDLKEKSNTTIIVITSETEEVANLADRVVLMNDGKVVYNAPPREFFANVPLLTKNAVPPPQVTEFSYYLKEKGIVDWDDLPLTLEEAIDRFSDLLSKKVKSTMTTSDTETERGSQTKGREYIQVNDIKFQYPDGTVALRGISTKIYDGDYIGIIGQNGSGKTTFVKHLNGLLHPTEGDVIVDGLNTKEAVISDITTRVGYIFQNPDHQIFSPSVWDEVTYSLKLMKLPDDEIKRRATEALELTGLINKKDEYPFFLNKGERQLLAISSILAMDPKVIILDEPTTGQDFKSVNRIMNLMDKLHSEKNKIIIVISHNMKIIAEHVKRVIVIHKGKILIDGDTRNVFAKPDVLKEVFIKPPQISLLSYNLQTFGYPPCILTIDEMLSRTLKILG
ncbi:MAG: ABC transporter ATP-binding protein [Candidatus Asgardarchaeia archaeon]